MPPRLSHSDIEYIDYNWGFYSGCWHWRDPDICPLPNCWAKGIAGHYRKNFPRGFDPTFYPGAFLSPTTLRKPSLIGMAFTGDLFGDWVDTGSEFNLSGITGTLKYWISAVIKECPHHTFLCLTKNPAGLLKWNPFPDNCWPGVSVWDRESLLRACRTLQRIEAKVKWLSIEPMLGDTWVLRSTLAVAGIRWVVIGAQTRPYLAPEMKWLEQMEKTCNRSGIAIFLKNNLKPLLLNHADDKRFVSSCNHGESEFNGLELKLRQEYPLGTRNRL